MLARFFIALTRGPWIALAAIVAFAGWAASVVHESGGGRRLDIDPSIASILPAGGPASEVYERTRARYGDDDVLLVAWIADDTLFTPETLARLARLTKRLERLEGVRRIDSLATALSIRTDDGLVEIDDFLRELPSDAAGAARLRREALANPLLRGPFVSPDGRGTLLAVHPDPGLSPAGLLALGEALVAASRAEAGALENFVSGPAYARLEISRLLSTDLRRVLPIAVLVTLLVAAATLRSVHGVLLPLAASGGAVLGAVALFLQAGHAFNFVTVIAPPVIFVVGFAYAVHLVASFDDELVGGRARGAAVQAALEQSCGPITLNASLEAVGFASLALSDIEAIRSFGLYAALGIALAWFLALVLVPAGLQLVPAQARTRAPMGRATSASLAREIAAFDVRHRRLLVGTGAALAVLSLLLATRIEVGTDYLRILPPTSPVPAQFERLADVFDGAVPLQVVLESDVPNLFKDPQQLATLDELQQWLADQPEVGSVVSLVDYLGVLYRAFVPEAPADAAIPPGEDLVDQLLLLGADADARRFTDSRYSSAVLHVRSSAIATGDLAALVARIEERLAALPEHLRGEVTGSSVLLTRAIDEIVRGQIESLAVTALVIYLVLALLFGSLRVGAVALVPNLLPILFFFGILGATGLALDFTTSLVAPIVLAIVIDDTVHFLSRYNAEARRTANEAQGLERALAASLRPMTFSTLGLAAGFLALTTSALRNQAEFGALAATIMVLAWLLDLSFTPALASRMRFVTLWESLTVDLGCTQPERSIPLFAGLSARQARSAALMGSILGFASGARLFSHGEPAKEIYVVLEGELLAVIPHEQGDTLLRRFRQGDLIGAASLFHGRHFADVSVTQAARVLRLSEQCLERIQRRYPRIGAQLYRNLSAIMSERLADMAQRV